MTRPTDRQPPPPQKKRRISRIGNFAASADHRVKLNESEKIKYLDLAREQKLWNMKATVMPIVVGVLGTINNKWVKGLGDLEIRGLVGTILTTSLIGSARILRRVLEIYCHSNVSEKPSTYICMKNSQKIIIIIIISWSNAANYIQKENEILTNWIGKVIHFEMWNRLKLYHTSKWYMYQAEFLLKHET